MGVLPWMFHKCPQKLPILALLIHTFANICTTVCLLVSIYYILTITIIFKCIVISKMLLYTHIGRILLCTCTYLYTVLQRYRLNSSQIHISTRTYHTRSKAHQCTPHACMYSCSGTYPLRHAYFQTYLPPHLFTFTHNSHSVPL